MWSAKVEALLQSLQPILEAGECAIVFSQFVGFLNVVEMALDEISVPSCKITGRYSTRKILTKTKLFRYLGRLSIHMCRHLTTFRPPVFSLSSQFCVRHLHALIYVQPTCNHPSNH